MTDHFPEPVRVHIASIEKDARVAPRKKRRALITHTFQLTAADPVQQILRQADNRVEAYMITQANDVLIATSRADAQNQGNGCATVPHSDTAPFPVNTTDEVWATSGTLPTAVSVVAFYEQDDL